MEERRRIITWIQKKILVASVNNLSNDSYLQEFIRLLNHEVLHSILHEEVGREACVQLDNIDDLFYSLTDETWKMDAD
jgi:hypothetical protein